MIRFGPAGIPLSCKGRTLKDGIEDVHNLGLNAMEVQMVRVNVVERFPDEGEVGMKPLEIESDLIVEIVRRKGKKEVHITNLEEKIKEEDSLITLSSGLVQNYRELQALGKMGKELDVELSMHTPYYMDLISNSELTKKSMNSIRWAGIMTDQMGGAMVTTHIGLYGHLSKKKATESIKENLGTIADWWKQNKIRPKLGLELSGRLEVWGSLNEILNLCDDVDGPVPVINFAHYHARENGKLREPSDFAELFDKTKKHVGKLYYTHFSGVEHEGGNEKRVTPIKKGDLRFEPLAEYLVEANPNCTIISSSPLLEHDAMYMKVIFERILTKKVVKDVKTKKEDKSEKPEKEEKEKKEKKGKKPSKPAKRSHRGNYEEEEEDDEE
ncbi:MAG: TIM barrel protein [Methanomassiliicoccales archaeon]|nr:TIM barrel protein [Methanomassiliicoccales archaeon]